MGLEFSAFRDVPFPTQYGPSRSAVSVDLIEAGLAAAFLILLLSLLLVLPGVKGWRKAVSLSVRVGFALFVASVILVCNFGYEWQVGHVRTNFQYKQFTHQHVDAELGLRIGLRGINVTLKGQPSSKVLIDNATETVDYNEHFNFGWDQQLNGFGPNAAELNQEFRQGQRRGLPLPILAVVEYFALDGESIRWGRLYRQAGYYTHIMMWLALPMWILCCFLATYLSLLYGAVCLMLTGACLLWACVIFVAIHTTETQLVIPIEENKQLSLHYGWTFGLSLATGMLCMVVGLVLTILVCYKPLWAAEVFSTSLLEVDDEDDEEDVDDDDTHDYERVRPRLLTFIAGPSPRAPVSTENGTVMSPGGFSRTSIRNSFRRRRVSRQPSAASAVSGANAPPRPAPRQWRRPRSMASVSGMTVIQPAQSTELKPISVHVDDDDSSQTASAHADANKNQPMVILYNAVEVVQRPPSVHSRSSGSQPVAAKRRPPAPPKPPARTVSRVNTGTSVLPSEDVTYTTQSTREFTL